MASSGLLGAPIFLGIITSNGRSSARATSKPTTTPPLGIAKTIAPLPAKLRNAEARRFPASTLSLKSCMLIHPSKTRHKTTISFNIKSVADMRDHGYGQVGGPRLGFE